MKNSIKKFAVAAVGTLSMLVAGTAVNAQEAADGQAPQALPQGWFKVCDKQDGNEVCSVRNIMTANTGRQWV